MNHFTIKGLEDKFVSFNTIGDGSCLLHSVLFCFNKKYRNSNPREKQIMTKELRNNLSDVLSEKIQNSDKTYYQNLSRGELSEISQFVPEAKIEFMKGYLKTQYFLNYSFLELISEQLNLDIYIINSHNGTIYMTGDYELYYKNRRSVIIKYIDQAHFESVGLVVNNEKVETLFSKNCTVIKRLQEIIKSKIN